MIKEENTIIKSKMPSNQDIYRDYAWTPRRVFYSIYLTLQPDWVASRRTQNGTRNKMDHLSSTHKKPLLFVTNLTQLLQFVNQP